MSTSRITELAGIISSNTSKVDEYLRQNVLPQPSFEIDGPVNPIPDAPEEIEKARDSAVEASIELQQLLQGTDSLLFPHVSTVLYIIEMHN